MSHDKNEIERNLAILNKITLLGIAALGSSIKVERWLIKPNRALNGATPISIINTDEGVEKIKSIFIRIEYGVFS